MTNAQSTEWYGIVAGHIFAMFDNANKSQEVVNSSAQLQDTVVDHALEDSVCEMVTDDSDNCRTVQIQNSDAKQTRPTTKSRMLRVSE